jgi:hypothetical protein
MGGLGNQIFQIFATIAYAIKSKNQFKFKSSKESRCGSSTLRYTYWDTFFNKFKPFLLDEMPPTNIIRETDFTYNDLPITSLTKVDLMIFGYFQSYKYFENYYELICRMICLEQMKNDLKNRLKLNDEYFKNSVSIHFRIGDYKKFQNIHPIMKYNYYKKAIKQMINIYPTNRFNFIYFCENDDIDDVTIIINKLINRFPNFNFIRGDNRLEDWEQMLFMSCCNHNIIANSSFSWWSAYFNSNKSKIVCYPSVWFGEKANHDTKDLCPPEWFKIYFQ